MAGLFGNIALSEQLVLSYIIGIAGAPAVEPYVRSLVNIAWETHPVFPPTIYTTVRGVAEGKVTESKARTWAHQQGFSDDVFDELLAGSLAGADFGNLMSGWRRGLIGQTGFETGLTRLGIEQQWWPMLEGLKRTHLSPAEAANARQQQFITDVEQRDTAALYGIEPQDADVQFELAGLPPGVETGLEMWRRGIIDQATFDRIIAEGHTKTKYTGDLEQLRDRVLNASVYVRAYLKGHIDRPTMHTGGALTGYTAPDLDLWELTEGRPATAHEIHIGYARGATLPGAANELDAIAIAVKESDIRPEYTEIIQAGRWSYPSPFVLRGLAQSGDLGDTAAVDQILLEIGWKPDLAAKVAAAWTGGATATSDPHEAKAQTQLWNTTHKSYIAEEIDDATATAALEGAGVTAAAVPAILALWKQERALIRKQLSPTQIRKALNLGVTNPATGAPWTQQDAINALLARGYDLADATVFLSE